MPPTHSLRRLRLAVRRVRWASVELALAMLLVAGCARPQPLPAAAPTLAGQRQALPTFTAKSPIPFGTTLPSEVRSVYVRVPQTALPGQPLHVLVALHGIGGDGQTFARDLTVAADQYGWVLVAPTIAYGDWMDPALVAHEDALLVTWLSGYLAQLPTQTNQSIDSGVLLLGFSRGAQLAHRFAEAYPEHALAVAAVSAGSYTLPQATAADGSPLLFPFGVGDFPTTVGQVFAPSELQSVHFWLGVGNNDTNPADVPRQFDPYQGDDRLDRARAFVAALGTINVSAALTVFPDVSHELTPAMQDAAVAFLAGQSTPAG
jgi:pimeloyl-ACP methyl ester carboxylesterase